MTMISNTFNGEKSMNNMTDSEFAVILAEFASEEMNEEEAYSWLYAVTLAVYEINTQDAKCSKGTIKRWRDLADLWGACAAERTEPNIFSLAIHRIHWGVYPNDYPQYIPTDVVDEVIKLIKKDSNAYRG